MSTSFSVVMGVRHRFGDKKTDLNEPSVDSAAPHVGLAHDFPFTCPNVDPAEEAILQFQFRGSTQRLTFPSPQPDGSLVGITAEHPVKINGQQLFGGVPGAPFRFGEMPLWSTRVLFIGGGILREENLLRIESTVEGSLTGKNFDDFTIDNVVVFFKTRPSPGGSPGGSVVTNT